jgi:hypothetical protein
MKTNPPQKTPDQTAEETCSPNRDRGKIKTEKNKQTVERTTKAARNENIKPEL